LQDKAVATSSPTGTMFGTGPVGHILNPETGIPAPANWRRVSVIHRSAALADGLSTAAVLLSAMEMADMAKQFPHADLRAVERNGIVTELSSRGETVQVATGWSYADRHRQVQEK